MVGQTRERLGSGKEETNLGIKLCTAAFFNLHYFILYKYYFFQIITLQSGHFLIEKF